jgi:O-antigen/teichoic acid export membrane protein
MTSVGQKIASGAAWMVLFRLLERAIGLISTLILARLLVPADFGIIAMAMSFVAILELLWTFSFDSALIQQKNADRSHYDTAWTLNIGMGLVIAGGLLAIAQPAASFYGDDRLVALISCLAIGSFLQGFENVGVVAFRKELRFGTDFLYQLARKLSGFIVTIPLAFMLRNYWALAAGMVSIRIVSLALSYVAHPYRPRFSLAARGSLVGFSKWLFFNSVLFSIQTRAQDFVVGKLAGPNGLGLFNVAHEISTFPTTAIVFPINRAVFPGFAKLAEQPGALVAGYLNVMGITALLALPAGLGIAATAKLLVPVALGDKWIEAIQLIEVLAVYGSLAAMGSVFGPTFMALGRPKMLSAFTVINVTLFVPIVVYGTHVAGVAGAAWGCLAVVCLMMPASHWMASRALHIPGKEILSRLWRPLAASAAMYAIVRGFVHAVGAQGSFSGMLSSLIAAVTLGVTVYASVLCGLWFATGRPAGPELTLTDALLARLRRGPPVR